MAITIKSINSGGPIYAIKTVASGIGELKNLRDVSLDNAQLSNSDILVYNSSEEKWKNANFPYEISFFHTGSLSANTIVYKIKIPQKIEFNNQFANSLFHSENSPDNSLSLKIKKNSTQVGSLTISTSGMPSFSNSEILSYDKGDILSIMSPNTITGQSITDFCITLSGKRI